MSDDQTRTEFDAAAEMGGAMADPQTAGDDARPFSVLPPGYTLHDLEPTLQLPLRARGKTTLADEASFVQQLQRLKTFGTVVYVSPTDTPTAAPTFVAVLNDHISSAAPHWRDHRAVYTPKLSVEWAKWTAASGNVKSQADFAAFIEDRVPDIAEPAGATMLEVALSIEARQKVNFASGVRLQNGAHQLTYEETIEGSAGKGQLTIPELIVIAIPVLLNGPRYRVEARLRYRIKDARLTMWVELVRPHDILSHAIDETRKRIAEQTTLPILVGLPD